MAHRLDFPESILREALGRQCTLEKICENECFKPGVKKREL